MKNVREIYLGIENTAQSRILNFLDKFNDPNYLHRERIMPGMFYLYLLEPLAKRPVKKIKIEFKKFSPYPVKLIMRLEEYREALSFSFLNSSRIKLCEGYIKYSDTFYNANKNKFRKVFEIPGYLQEEFGKNKPELFGKDNSAMYLTQEIEFSRNFHTNSYLKIGEHKQIGKRKYSIAMTYISHNQKPDAEGYAEIIIIPRKILDRTLEGLIKNMSNSQKDNLK